jgi:hypothetical protein
MPAYDAVDVGPSRGENDTCGVAKVVATSRRDHDAVRRHVEADAVPPTKRSRVGEVRIDLRNTDSRRRRPRRQERRDRIRQQI